jgi:outer membrane protein TolC
MTDEAIDPTIMDSGKDPLIASVSISLPIWFGVYGAREREAEARHAAALGDRRDRENRLAVSVETALYGYEEAVRRLDLYGNTLIPRGRQALEVTRQAFEGGESSFLDLVDAQRSLLEFELSHERARADRAIRRAEIERLIGSTPIHDLIEGSRRAPQEEANR